jgi:hypothetical protein
VHQQRYYSPAFSLKRTAQSASFHRFTKETAMTIIRNVILPGRKLAIAVVCALACITGNHAFAQSAVKLEIRTLSSRPDLVNGGDALVEVRAPAGLLLSQITLTLNGKDVTGLLKDNLETSSFRGVIGGMTVGENTLRAVINSPGKPGNGGQASLTVKNYPITGPILSGPHLTPYECRTVESGLGQPLDANCSAAQKIEYFYRASNNTFKPFDPGGSRPTDLVNTTTNDGKTVPYIVRVDSGTINRSIYRIAILDDPRQTVAAAAPPSGQTFIRPVSLENTNPPSSSAWRPGPGWNGKLAVSFGGGAGTQYNQGVNQATAALNHVYLSRGFAFMISTELVNQQHGNAVLQGEALMMLKEYFIERYGVPKWTVGYGGSGGAIQQLLITEIYPGLLDGPSRRCRSLIRLCTHLIAGSSRISGAKRIRRCGQMPRRLRSRATPRVLARHGNGPLYLCTPRLTQRAALSTMPLRFMIR